MISTSLASCLVFALAVAPIAPVETGGSRAPAPVTSADASKRARTVVSAGWMELTLGSVSLAASAALVGNGAWELTKANALLKSCERGIEADPLCQRTHPVRGHHAAAGLSFAFVLPLVIAAGFALAHGIRENRDARRQARRVRFSSDARGVSLRF